MPRKSIKNIGTDLIKIAEQKTKEFKKKEKEYNKKSIQQGFTDEQKTTIYSILNSKTTAKKRYLIGCLCNILTKLTMVIFISLFFVSYCIAAVEESQENSDGNDYMNATTWLMQSFTANETYTLDKVNAKLYRVGSPGTITVNIYLADENKKPTGEVLTTGTINGNEITTDTNGEWYDIELSNYEVTADEEYTITMHSEANYVRWRDISTGGYPGGIWGYSANSGSTWITDANYDFTFHTYSVDPTPTPTPTPTPEPTIAPIEAISYTMLYGSGFFLFLLAIITIFVIMK